MRNQGLPFSTIVLAVISILILVLVVFFVTGGLSRILPQSQRFIDEKASFRSECSRLLNDIQNRLSLGRYPDATTIRDIFTNSEYCTRKIRLGNNDFYCYSNEIGIFAKFSVYTEDGVVVNCEASPNKGCSCS